jgi:hypothetical protein
MTASGLSVFVRWWLGLFIAVLILAPPAPPAYGPQSPTYMIALFIALGVEGFLFAVRRRRLC